MVTKPAEESWTVDTVFDLEDICTPKGTDYQKMDNLLKEISEDLNSVDLLTRILAYNKIQQLAEMHRTQYLGMWQKFFQLED